MSEIEISRRAFLHQIGSETVETAGKSALVGWLLREIVPPLAMNAGNRIVYKDGSAPTYNPLDEVVDIDGARVRQIGVTHLAEVFVDNEEDIRERVKKSPFVILEYFTPGMRKLALPTVTDEALLDQPDFDSQIEAFFSGVGRVCAKEGRDVIVANPQNDIAMLVENAAMVGAPTIFAYRTAKESYNNKTTLTITRRSFLKYGPAAFMIASYAALPRLARNALARFAGIDLEYPIDQQAEVLGWSYFDYRDIRVAQGIEMIIENYRDEVADFHEIPLIQGDRHSGVPEYIANPNMRKAKLAMYPHFNATSDDMVRRYRYDSWSNSWDMVDEFSLD